MPKHVSRFALHAALAVATLALCLLGCSPAAPASVAPAPTPTPIEPAHPQSALARSVLLKSLPPDATNLRWFGPWYLLYSSQGATFAGIAYPNPVEGGITVLTKPLYQNPPSF